MPQSIEILASAIHDAKNQLFFADNLAAATAEKHDIDLDAVRKAMNRAVSRLTRALMGYRLDAGVLPVSISAVPVHGLLEDAAMICEAQYAHLGLPLEIHCDVDGVWPLDRDLVLDVINNGLENAARFARSKVALCALCDAGALLIRVEDDGPGYGNTAATTADNPGGNRGLGLHIGRQIAGLHRRHGHCGELREQNGGRWGGAVLELRLP